MSMFVVKSRLYRRRCDASFGVILGVGVLVGRSHS